MLGCFANCFEYPFGFVVNQFRMKSLQDINDSFGVTSSLAHLHLPQQQQQRAQFHLLQTPFNSHEDNLMTSLVKLLNCKLHAVRTLSHVSINDFISDAKSQRGIIRDMSVHSNCRKYEYKQIIVKFNLRIEMAIHSVWIIIIKLKYYLPLVWRWDLSRNNLSSFVCIQCTCWPTIVAPLKPNPGAIKSNVVCDWIISNPTECFTDV